MKILFMSDIHGITNNLDYIKKLDGKEQFDKVVVLGDLYYAGPTYDNSFEVNSMEVKDFLMGFKDRLICMRGNCDSDVDIKSSDFPICTNLSLLHVDGIDIYLTHGDEYSKYKNRKFDRQGVLVYGHEHIPYIETIDDMTYICVGSISLPRSGNEPSYMIYENKKFTIYSIDGEIIDFIDIKLNYKFI